MIRRTSARGWITCLAATCTTSATVVADNEHKMSPSASDAHVIFSAPLPDIPGQRLVATVLEFAPGRRMVSPHRHPGSVYVYVTKGAMRLGIQGQPVQVVHAGESFFEPPGALHNVADNASATEPASAIAVQIAPEGVPLLTVEKPN